MKALHLVRRFFRALRPGPPSQTDEAWVASVLTPVELEIWARQPEHDRRYSIRVARRVQRDLQGTEYAEDDCWLAAALLHDVGKLDASLGVVARSFATVAGAVRPSTRQSSGRFGRYLRHDELGAEMLRAAGARDEAAEWAGVHHHRERWARTGIPAPVAAVLETADNS